MQEQVTARLEELRKDYEAGEKRLQMLESDAIRLRETLLRISGAIQVLQELLDSSGQGSLAHRPPAILAGESLASTPRERTRLDA